MTDTLDVEIHADRASVWLNRPQARNAFDAALIARLAATARQLAADRAVRVIVLGGRGSHFCAGGDARWMQEAAAAGPGRNRDDALALADMLDAWDRLPQPTVARVQGAAFGGGLGLVAVCDICVADPGARFAASEVRLGLIPATIGPYVLAAIGPRQARRWFLSGESFDAATAQAMGLVHVLAGDAALDDQVDALCRELRRGAPGAQQAAKAMIRAGAGTQVDDAQRHANAELLAKLREGGEAAEGLAAFLARRAPGWDGGA